MSDHSEYKLYRFHNFEATLLTKITIKNFSEVYFKEFGKDLIVLEANNLTAYYFKKSKIKTFLKDKSIRTVRQLSGHNYIVATDKEGFFFIDIKNNTERQLKLMDKDTELSINYSRDIFVEANGTIITGDSDNLYTLDQHFRVIKNRTVKIKGEEIIRIQDTLFTANQNGGIYKHSTKDTTSTTIANTESIEVKEFATDGETLYATTNKGILEYNHGTFRTWTFKNEATENLLAITYLPQLGLLVSTKFGKVYTVNTTTKKLHLLYEDDLGASIVGMVKDNYNTLWFNTYAGIVRFNPKTKKRARYTLKDGVYELEGNRFSSYKDPEGNIFMGSYKGLSVFKPNQLVENAFKAELQFTSVAFFNARNDRWEINTTPNFLKNTATITLPAEYRRFSTTISVFGAVSPQDLLYRYRLLSNESNSDWFTNYAGKEILYANLAAGTYTLQIEALNASKKKIGETLELKIIAEEVFYKSWLFIAIILLTIAGIVLYLFYVYKLKKDLFAKNEIALNEAEIKNAMMLEIHHRIKNNLQIVSGLLGLQMNDSTSEELKTKLQDSQNRIESIAGIHNTLYNTTNQDSIAIKDNVAHMVGYYKKLYMRQVSYRVEIDSSILSIDKVTPFSLLLNELINNSNKHAFTRTTHPEIFIRFYRQDNTYLFEYNDNGEFKKQETTKESMGMRIIEMMNKQLQGTVTIKNYPSFKLILLFETNE